MRRTLNLTVLLFSALVPCCMSVRLNAADEISGELVGLNVSLAAEKQLVVSDQLVAAGEWETAIDLLDRLKVDGGETLVKVSPGRYVGLPIAIQQRLCLFSAAGREVYQRRTGTITQSWMERARREHDESVLWRILEESSATTAAPEAAQELASMAASRGDLELALRIWGRVIAIRELANPEFPPAMLGLPASDPRRVRASFIQTIVARNEIGVPFTPNELRTMGGADVATWSLAGRPLTEWLPPNSASSLESPSIGPLQLVVGATTNCPLPEFQSSLPVYSRGELLLLNNGQQVRALNCRTGEPFWPTGVPQDVGIVFEEIVREDESLRELPCRIAGSVGASDRYFGVLGDAPRWRPRPGLVPLSGSLIALDLAEGEGRMLWRVESRDLPEPEWLFHGQPVLSPGALPCDDLVIVPLCRPAPQVELALAAFSQDDGHFFWFTRLGTCAAEPTQPLAVTQVISNAGLIVARTLTGVVVALEARRGRIQWASTSMIDSPPSQQGSSATLLDASAGVVVVADPVQSQVAGFSLDSGERLWQMMLPDSIQGVVCSQRGQVLIAGKRLRAVSLWQGIPRWEFGSDDIAAAGTGVPVVAGSTVFWPTRTGIWGLELNRGTIEFRRVLASTPVACPMQLQLIGDHWILSRPDTTAVFCSRPASK